MTVLTKFDLSAKKDQLPLVDENLHNEAKVDLGDMQEIPQDDTIPNLIIVRKKRDACLSNLCCVLLCGLLVTIIGILGGMRMYIQLNKPSQHHYKGWCAIPYDNLQQQQQQQQEQQQQRELKLIEPHFSLMSLPPSSLTVNSRDVELLDDIPHAPRDFATDIMPNYLKEEFDIGDNFERIIVGDHIDGRQTNILHDFSSNFSGIIDADRCFVMTLDSNNVMQPNMFIRTIQGQSDFDITTVNNIMRALLPALADLSGTGRFIKKECSDRPTYMLKMMPSGTIRKRSADLPHSAKFVQFSGRHIQEIDIDNMDALLSYEEKTANTV